MSRVTDARTCPRSGTTVVDLHPMQRTLLHFPHLACSTSSNTMSWSSYPGQSQHHQSQGGWNQYPGQNQPPPPPMQMQGGGGWGAPPPPQQQWNQPPPPQQYNQGGGYAQGGYGQPTPQQGGWPAPTAPPPPQQYQQGAGGYAPPEQGYRPPQGAPPSESVLRSRLKSSGDVVGRSILLSEWKQWRFGAGAPALVRRRRKREESIIGQARGGRE